MVSKEFILAGQATFTIEIPPQHQAVCGDKTHYTFRVDYVEASDRWAEAWFVKMLAGPNNEEDYVYVGKLNDHTGQVNATAKSTIRSDSAAYKLLNRTLARIWCDDHNAYEQHGFQVHHEGKCGRCGRKLTTPESVKTGIGPVCSGRKRGDKTTDANPPEHLPGEATVSPYTGMRYTGD